MYFEGLKVTTRMAGISNYFFLQSKFLVCTPKQKKIVISKLNLKMMEYVYILDLVKL